VIEALAHDRHRGGETGPDFVGDGEGQHEVLTAGADRLCYGEDAAEIVGRVAKTPGAHVAVEEIDVADQAGIVERRLVAGSSATADEGARPLCAVIRELLAQPRERLARQGTQCAAEAVQDVALKELPNLTR
jgi:hypothetical protein